MLTVNVPSPAPEGCIDMSDLLAFAPDFTGVVVSGDQRGRTLGYPTANIDVTAADVVPADGIYACLVNFQPGPEWHEATLSIGTNPTFDDVADRRVEVFIHDLSADFYECIVGVKVARRLRNTIRFNTPEELVTRSADDVRRSRAALKQFLKQHNNPRRHPTRPEPFDPQHSDEVIEP